VQVAGELNGGLRLGDIVGGWKVGGLKLDHVGGVTKSVGVLK